MGDGRNSVFKGREPETDMLDWFSEDSIVLNETGSGEAGGTDVLVVAGAESAGTS